MKRRALEFVVDTRVRRLVEEQVREAAGETVREIDDVVERQHADIYRDHPFLRPADELIWLRRILDSDELRRALQLI